MNIIATLSVKLINVKTTIKESPTKVVQSHTAPANDFIEGAA
jgi:hypothetical protein